MQQVHMVSRQVGMQLSWPMVSDRTQVCGCPEQHRALSSPTRMHAALCRSPQPCARSHGHASPATAWKRLWLLLKSLLSSLRCRQRPWPRLSLQTSKALIPVTHNNTIGHLLVGFMACHAAETAAKHHCPEICTRGPPQIHVLAVQGSCTPPEDWGTSLSAGAAAVPELPLPSVCRA